jgi:hypothetical protein
VSLRSFRVFLEEEMVAVVRCEAAPAGTSYRYLLEITQREGPNPGRREKFPMSGDQWSIGGDILKWKPWLTFLGIKSCHKLTRLSSRYETAKEEMSRPRTAYDLNGGATAPWRWLQRWGIHLPFVDAVYGNSVYVPARPGGRWGLYATHSGYVVRPAQGSSG